MDWHRTSRQQHAGMREDRKPLNLPKMTSRVRKKRGRDHDEKRERLNRKCFVDRLEIVLAPTKVREF